MLSLSMYLSIYPRRHLRILVLAKAGRDAGRTGTSRSYSALSRLAGDDGTDARSRKCRRLPRVSCPSPGGRRLATTGKGGGRANVRACGLGARRLSRLSPPSSLSLTSPRSIGAFKAMRGPAFIEAELARRACQPPGSPRPHTPTIFPPPVFVLLLQISF